MQISKISISNVLGIKELNLDAGKYIEISGKNGKGKTSVIEAISAALKGGTDATLIRNGEEKGEVVIVFDDGMVLNRTIGKTGLKLTDKNGKAINKPQNFLNELYDIIAVNPIEFLKADKKDRTRLFLEAMPIELKDDEIKDIYQGYTANISLDITGHPLEYLDAAHKRIYDERREISRVVKEKTGAVNQLKDSIVELDYDPAEIESKISELVTKQDERKKKKDDYLQGLQNALHTKLQEIENTKIEILKQMEQQKEQMISNFNEIYNPAEIELAQLREAQKHTGGALKTKEIIAQYENELVTMDGNIQDLNTSLDTIQKIKARKLENLPIKGLTIKDNEIYKDDVNFDRLNTAEQRKVAIELAKLRAGTLNIVCVDGLESFDTENYEAFKQDMIDSGLQAIVTRVSDEPFEINNA